MSHNLSRRAAREAVLATPISRYGKCVLVLTCALCRERRELPIKPLIADGRGGEKTDQFLMRLRCRTCGNMPDTVRLQRRAGQVSPANEIVLVGPGAD